jgi:hypothetical protein
LLVIFVYRDYLIHPEFLFFVLNPSEASIQPH